jgi:hypothetical protein
MTTFRSPSSSDCTTISERSQSAPEARVYRRVFSVGKDLGGVGSLRAFQLDQTFRLAAVRRQAPDSTDALSVNDSPASGRWPMWSKRGDEIFYRQGRRMMSVSVEGDDELQELKRLVPPIAW